MLVRTEDRGAAMGIGRLRPEMSAYRATPRVLIYSHVFAPSVGGSETACRQLAQGLAERNYEVRVVTQTKSDRATLLPFPVFRRPSIPQHAELVRWSDVVVHSNISLRALWPLALTPRPWIVVHHSALAGESQCHTVRSWLKQLAARYATNISVSHSMASSLRAPSYVLGNAYQEDTFWCDPTQIRRPDLIFVGRLVPTKGADLAIRMLAQLRREGTETNLTIIGDGPCGQALRELSESLGVSDFVRFLGNRSPREVAKQLNQHLILVAPSMGAETFGLSALEALACGCIPVVSNVGGLPETVSNHGVVFPEGDLDSLTAAVRGFLKRPEKIQSMLEGVEFHLQTYREERVVNAFAEIISHVSSGGTMRQAFAQLTCPLLLAGQALASL